MDGFEWIFINVSKSAAFSLRHQKTTSNIHNTFKRQIKVQQWFTTGGSYVHKPMIKFSGASPKCYLFAIFSKYWWFQTKRSIRLLEFIKLYKNPLENVFNSEFTLPLLWTKDKNQYLNDDEFMLPLLWTVWRFSWFHPGRKPDTLCQEIALLYRPWPVQWSSL